MGSLILSSSIEGYDLGLGKLSSRVFIFRKSPNIINNGFLPMHHPISVVAYIQKLWNFGASVFHNEDGNPARANIKQALGYLKDGDGDGNSQPHKGVKASANSDVMYSFTSAQDGDPLQDDVRLCLGDDLKKAQDHSQRQA
ncbi:hypothetical protein Tco_0686020 [Tanacetum coccineum]